MAFQGIRIKISGVGKGYPRVSVETVDRATGAFYSHTNNIPPKEIKAFVGQAITDAKEHAKAHAIRQAEEELAMNGKYPVE